MKVNNLQSLNIASKKKIPEVGTISTQSNIFIGFVVERLAMGFGYSANITYPCMGPIFYILIQCLSNDCFVVR